MHQYSSTPYPTPGGASSYSDVVNNTVAAPISSSKNETSRRWKFTEYLQEFLSIFFKTYLDSISTTESRKLRASLIHLALDARELACLRKGDLRYYPIKNREIKEFINQEFEDHIIWEGTMKVWNSYNFLLEEFITDDDIAACFYSPDNNILDEVLPFYSRASKRSPELDAALNGRLDFSDFLVLTIILKIAFTFQRERSNDSVLSEQEVAVQLE